MVKLQLIPLHLHVVAVQKPNGGYLCKELVIQKFQTQIVIDLLSHVKEYLLVVLKCLLEFCPTFTRQNHCIANSDQLKITMLNYIMHGVLLILYP